MRNFANRRPVTRVHIDQSYEGAERRLRFEFPSTENKDEDDANALLTRRYQIINLWRPIVSVFRDPLAVADATSIPDVDLVAAELTEGDFVGESWVSRYNPNHRWYYKHGMGREDVLLIKCFDSREDVARRSLHSAFECYNGKRAQLCMSYDHREGNWDGTRTGTAQRLSKSVSRVQWTCRTGVKTMLRERNVPVRVPPENCSACL